MNHNEDGALRFPQGFRWGTATAAHQVEGYNTNNQWWAWEQQPGRIANGDTSGAACDWWHNAERDFDYMVQLCQNAHRLSVEWSRIEPQEGRFDTAALERYRALLKALRERDIEPMVTLHHFTNPLWLEEQRAWLKADRIAALFRRYVHRVVAALGDLCDLWCTVNEPNVYAVMSYFGARMPPGWTDMGAAITVMQNLLLAHAVAYEALHEAQPSARVGLAHHMRYFQGLRRNGLDGLAARMISGIFNDSVLLALLHGRWHWILWRGAPVSARKLRGTLDWIGLNYYTRQRIAFDHTGGQALFSTLAITPGAITSDYDFGEIYPEGMSHLLRQLARYRLPIFITENGLPDHDDDLRPMFIVRHLRALWEMIQLGCDVRGYYHWSLVDNFEWSEGWRMRFGLIEMDPRTQQRTLRQSAWLYRDISRDNAITEATIRLHVPELVSQVFPR
ncbi:MAG: glycoside hydrolase family 1 protein [Anaerolineae bacterium]|nr:glycoside hydrolase family 1 protein [Anaerolineae bacterium]